MLVAFDKHKNLLRTGGFLRSGLAQFCMQAAEECRGIAAVVCAAVFVEKADARTAVHRFDEYDDFGVGCRFLNFFAFTEHAAEEAGFFRGNGVAFVRRQLRP